MFADPGVRSVASIAETFDRALTDATGGVLTLATESGSHSA
jgi:hypothetical protein